VIDFNQKMQDVCHQLLQDYPSPAVYLSKINTLINNPEEIDKYKAKRHQGWRRHRATVRKIMGQEITPAEQEILLNK